MLHNEIFSFVFSPVLFKFSLKFSVIQFENKRVDLVCVVLGKTLCRKEIKNFFLVLLENFRKF